MGDFKNIAGRASGSSTATVALPSAGCYLLVVYHVYANVNSLYIINVYAGNYGAKRVIPITQAPQITVTNTSGLDVSIANADTANANYVFLRLSATM